MRTIPVYNVLINKRSSCRPYRRKGCSMNIIFHEKSKTFHLYNNEISYIMTVLRNGHLGQLYCGKHIRDREDFSHLLEMCERPMGSYVYDTDRLFSLDYLKQEMPVYGSTDYHAPALEIVQKNGSRIMDLQFVSYSIEEGKPELEGLPATYTESGEEALTLRIV